MEEDLRKKYYIVKPELPEEADPLSFSNSNEALSYIRNYQNDNPTTPIVEVDEQAVDRVTSNNQIYLTEEKNHLQGQLQYLQLWKHRLINHSCRILDQPMFLPSALIEDALTVGFAGIHEMSVAIASSGINQKANGSQVVLPLILNRGSRGWSLLKDEETKQLYTDNFWLSTPEGYCLVNTDKPIPLDGLFDVEDKMNELEGFSSKVDSKEILEITANKQRVKEILQKNGISVPPGIFISNSDGHFVKGKLEKLDKHFDTTNGFVVKGNNGSGGYAVQLYKQGETEQAAAFAHELFNQGQDIIIEQRIIPYSQDIDRDLRPTLEGGSNDFNVRVLTTLSSTASEVIDSEIRFGKKDSGPINIAQGAEAIRVMDVLPERLIKKVYNVSQLATEAICREAGENEENPLLGLAGTDVMIDQNENVFVLEVNTGYVGGLGTLCKLDERPLISVAQVLLPSWQPFLSKNHEQRVQPRINNLKRVQLGKEDRDWRILYEGMSGTDVRSIKEIENRIKTASYDEDYIFLDRLYVGFHIKGDFARALQCIEKMVELAPNEESLVQSHAMVLMQLNRLEEANTLLNRAAEKNPESGYVLKARVMYFQAIGNEKEARRLIRQLFNMEQYREDPRLTVLEHVILAQNYEDLGKKLPAKVHTGIAVFNQLVRNPLPFKKLESQENRNNRVDHFNETIKRINESEDIT